MKRLYILLVVCSFTFFNVQLTNAQSENNDKDVVFKTTKTKTPEKVKETLMNYSGYTIDNEVTYMEKKSLKVYKFKVKKGNWSHFILIDEKGKMLGIETGEH